MLNGQPKAHSMFSCSGHLGRRRRLPRQALRLDHGAWRLSRSARRQAVDRQHLHRAGRAAASCRLWLVIAVVSRDILIVIAIVSVLAAGQSGPHQAVHRQQGQHGGADRAGRARCWPTKASGSCGSTHYRARARLDHGRADVRFARRLFRAVGCYTCPAMSHDGRANARRKNCRQAAGGSVGPVGEGRGMAVRKENKCCSGSWRSCVARAG